MGEVVFNLKDRGLGLDRNKKFVVPDEVLFVSATVAATGADLAGAAALTAQVNAVTGADGAKGVRLPVAEANSLVIVINTDASNDLLIYPRSGAQINALGASNAFTLIAGNTAIFAGRSATLWYVGAATDTVSGLTASAAELNNAADVSARVQALTVSGAVAAGKQSVELNHATVIIAATIANAANHQGLFIVKDTSASGTAAHTLTLTAGTFDGTNNVATLNAPKEALLVYFDSAGNGSIVENIGGVALS